MRAWLKVFLSIFLFIFAFTGFVNVEEACSQPVLINLEEPSCVEFVTADCGAESYTALPQNNFDNGTSPNLHCAESKSEFQKLNYTEYKHKDNNINSVSFLFKTEIYPNAP